MLAGGRLLTTYAPTSECVAVSWANFLSSCIALESVGLEVLESSDKALDPFQVEPWYLPLVPSWNPIQISRFQFTPIGKMIMTKALKILEACWLAPKGTSKVQTMLTLAGEGCAVGGKEGIFTPMYYVLSRKPLGVAKEAKKTK